MLKHPHNVLGHWKCGGTVVAMKNRHFHRLAAVELSPLCMTV